MLGQAGRYLRRYSGADGYSGSGFAHWCPACEEAHAFAVDTPFVNGCKWTFNGNFDAPSFQPSMKITGKQTVVVDGEWTGEWVRDAQGNAVDYCCHYILTDARIAYCGDCTHALVGQTVPLPELPLHLRDAVNDATVAMLALAERARMIRLQA